MSTSEFRPLRGIFCLAGIVVVVMALRHGLYGYFHGDGRTLTSLWAALWR